MNNFVEYPIAYKIKERLHELEKTAIWLAAEMDMSQRWVQGIKSLEKLSLDEILLLSKILEINFLQDYKDWMLINANTQINIASDVQHPYVTKKAKPFTITLTVEGPENRIETNFGKFFKSVKQAAEDNGFEVK
jgi:hypothetical protein